MVIYGKKTKFITGIALGIMALSPLAMSAESGGWSDFVQKQNSAVMNSKLPAPTDSELPPKSPPPVDPDVPPSTGPTPTSCESLRGSNPSEISGVHLSWPYTYPTAPMLTATAFENTDHERPADGSINYRIDFLELHMTGGITSSPPIPLLGAAFYARIVQTVPSITSVHCIPFTAGDRYGANNLSTSIFQRIDIPRFTTLAAPPSWSRSVVDPARTIHINPFTVEPDPAHYPSASYRPTISCNTLQVYTEEEAADGRLWSSLPAGVCSIVIRGLTIR